MTFLSNDCDPDKLMLSLELSGLTGNLCGAPVDEFEMALESLAGVGDVHVSREDYSIAGQNGYSWAATLNSNR